METQPVTCPTCFEAFEIALPPESEVPCEVDYDCEVCCRPMIMSYTCEMGMVFAEARGVHD